MTANSATARAQPAPWECLPEFQERALGCVESCYREARRCQAVSGIYPFLYSNIEPWTDQPSHAPSAKRATLIESSFLSTSTSATRASRVCVPSALFRYTVIRTMCRRTSQLILTRDINTIWIHIQSMKMKMMRYWQKWLQILWSINEKWVLKCLCNN